MCQMWTSNTIRGNPHLSLIFCPPKLEELHAGHSKIRSSMLELPWFRSEVLRVRGRSMRPAKKQQLFKVALEFPGPITRTIQVKASSREVAERRALKRNPAAIAVARRA